ncbi:MAG: Wzz/FepE/Etk N-terminal domain-containing protein, partial [Pseudomonadota bacterium]
MDLAEVDPPRTALSFAELVRVLRRHARLISTAVVLGLGLALIYLFTVTPLYRAQALILVDPVEQNLLAPGQNAAGASTSLTARVESEVEILRSAAMALAVVRDARLVSDPEFG